MGPKTEFDVQPGGELNSTHLLALIVELKKVRVSEAQRKLQVDKATVDTWKDQLLSSGLIEIDTELSDGDMSITKAGFTKLKELGHEVSEVEEEERKLRQKNKKKIKLSIMASLERFKAKLPEDSKWMWIDLALVSSTLLSVYLLKMFLEDPNVQMLSFLVGTSILSGALVVYHQYKRHLRTKDVIMHLRWLPKTMMTYWHQFVLLGAVLIMVYLMMMLGFLLLNPERVSSQRLGIYIILFVVLASTAQLFYMPRKKWTAVIKYYTGVILMTFGLLLVVGLMSITVFFGNNIGILDRGFGLGFLFIVYLNEKWLGLGMPEKASSGNGV